MSIEGSGMNLNEAIAANRAREAAKRDVTLSSGKKITHRWGGKNVWLVNEDLSSDEWIEYVGLAKGRGDVDSCRL